jgi:glycosyltransferase involved in cell wall biosynthesis
MDTLVKISVVMATYNGHRYIYDQIASILAQLEPEDELIIVDDASRDDTLRIIDSFRSRQIKLFQNNSNAGVLASFERGLKYARNEYIFLSDQDDIWSPDKRRSYLDAFFQSKEIMLVISDLVVIDAEDKIISHSFMEGRGGFSGGVLDTLWKNRYIGCSIAIRRSVLNYCLPFPKILPMHDMWLGVASAILGRVCYLQKPYMQYRRHELNVTSSHPSSIPLILSFRLKLSVSIFILISRIAIDRVIRVFK